MMKAVVNCANTLDPQGRGGIKIAGNPYHTFVGLDQEDIRTQAKAHVHAALAAGIEVMRRSGADTARVVAVTRMLPMYGVHIEWDDDTSETLLVSMDPRDVAVTTSFMFVCGLFDRIIGNGKGHDDE